MKPLARPVAIQSVRAPSRRFAVLAAAVMLVALAALLGDRVLIVVNGPGVGTAVFVCGIRDEGRARTCGNDEFGVVMEEQRSADGAFTRHWYPGGTEYFRELGGRGEATKLIYRAVLPCWLGESVEGARGPPQGMEAISCIDGVGMGSSVRQH